MLKVKKSTKNDFKWRLNISRGTAVKAFKFCMILNLTAISQSFVSYLLPEVPIADS